MESKPEQQLEQSSLVDEAKRVEKVDMNITAISRDQPQQHNGGNNEPVEDMTDFLGDKFVDASG